MKNVIRLPPPPSLINNANKWKRQLLKEINRKKRTRSKVSDKFFDKYKKENVKKTLERMYNGLCCYCEEKIGVVEYGHIEHRKPKRKFPASTYDWNNMHLSCTICNNHKGDKYDKENPILDAVVDVPITDHLTYRLGDEGVWRFGITLRGETTKDHANLNREKLRVERGRFCLGVVEVITGIKSSPNTQESRFKRKLLKIKCRGRYGSMIEYLMNRLEV